MWECLSGNWSTTVRDGRGTLSRVGRLGVVVTALVLVSHPASAETPRVVIKGDGLHPRVLHATTTDAVLFVNETGRLVHVEFLGNQSRHHVAQVPGRISAVFHQEGPHRYVVHIESGSDRRELSGIVDVGHVPERPLSPRTCGWLTLEGICIAR